MRRNKQKAIVLAFLGVAGAGACAKENQVWLKFVHTTFAALAQEKSLQPLQARISSLLFPQNDYFLHGS